MKQTLLLAILASTLLAACSRAPVRTKEIYFYRGEKLNQGNPCAVDIIYPKDQAQRDKIREIGPENWFKSDLYDSPQIHKEKAWLDLKKGRSFRVPLAQKTKMAPYVIIFAEFTSPDKAPPVGREAYLLYEKTTRPRPRKVEHIYVHSGSLERLKKKIKPKDLISYE